MPHLEVAVMIDTGLLIVWQELHEESPGHPSILVGDLKLSDFKQTLTKAGLKARAVRSLLI